MEWTGLGYENSPYDQDEIWEYQKGQAEAFAMAMALSDPMMAQSYYTALQSQGPKVYSKWCNCEVNAFDVVAHDPTYQNKEYRRQAQNAIYAYMAQQGGADMAKLMEFGNFFFKNEMNLPNGFKLNIVLDYDSKYTTDVPGRRHAVTIPIMGTKTAKMYLNPILLKDAKNLYIHLGHELVHANDIANGNLTTWLKQFPKDIVNIMEAHGFMWSAAAEAGFGVNYTNSQQNLDYYTNLLPAGFSFNK